jgi:U3 small nucleolar RNA-associated protein 4
VNGEDALIHTAEHMSRKRKRPTYDGGAGSTMEVGSLGPRQVVKFGQDFEDVRIYQNEATRASRSEIGETFDDENIDRGDLQRLRNLQANMEVKKGGGNGRSGPSWGLTYKYRPILGIVPLNNPDDATTNGVLEVALVERPLWELDMPDRLVSSG